MTEPEEPRKPAIPPHSLEARLERALKDALRARPTADVILEVAASADFSLFMQKVRQKEHHRRLLSLHRADLLGAGANRAGAFLYLSSLQKPKGRQRVTTAGPSKALEHAVAVEVLSPDQMKDFFAGAFGLGPGDVSGVISAIADIAAYFGLVLVRSNESLRSLVSSAGFSFALMKERLGDYKSSVSTEAVKAQVNAILKGTVEADPDLARRVEGVLVPILAQIAKSGLPDLQKLVKAMPNLLLTLHLESQRIVSDLLEKSGLDFSQYIDVLEDMHLFNLIQSNNIIHWCENCSLEIPLIESSTGRIDPSKLARKDCMNCRNPMSYSAIYSPHELVKEALLCKDGFLSVLFGWCLRRDGIEYTIGEYAGELETDFIVIRPGAQTVIECKTFKVDKDDAAIRDEMRGALSQLGRQVKALRDKGAHVDRAFVLWNREEEISFDEMVSEFESKFKPIEARLFNHLQIEDAIRESKRP